MSQRLMEEVFIYIGLSAKLILEFFLVKIVTYNFYFKVKQIEQFRETLYKKHISKSITGSKSNVIHNELKEVSGGQLKLNIQEF